MARKDKDKALKLRLQGRSYAEITRLLGIPKATLSGWLKGVVLDDAARSRIAARVREKSAEGLMKRNKNQTKLAHGRMIETRKIASKEVGGVSQENLLILGAALYWAEGYKRVKVVRGREVTNHPVSLTNSDASLVRAFLYFLRDYCKVPNERIRMAIRLFEHQNEEEIMQYWQKETKLPKANFLKAQRIISRSSQGKRPFNRLPYGVVQISVADTPLFHRIMGYIEGIKKFV